MIIHAKNIRGLGALVLCSKVILKLRNDTNEVLASCELNKKLEELNYDLSVKEYPLSILGRLFELLFKKISYGKQVCLVLGDIPLKISSHQILYLHNLSLFEDDTIKDYQSLKRYINRIILKKNIKYVDAIIVQSEHAKQKVCNFITQYCQSDFKGKITNVEMNICGPKTKRCTIGNSNFKLFYPARNYPHKNHELIFRSASSIFSRYPDCEILLTLDEGHVFDSRLKALGEISETEVMRIMANDDVVLLFPSLIESLGLPLIEALREDIPILAADLAYAHELCGDAAIYFDPRSTNSLCNAISKLRVNKNIIRTKRIIDIYSDTAQHIKRVKNEFES